MHNRSTDEDARALLSGKLTGRPQNHTALECTPWWSVDLGDIYQVHEIRLFNRMDGCFERMSNFAIFSFEDGKNGHSNIKKMTINYLVVWMETLLYG
ncbi:galactose-binding domain-containing protein [Acetobacter fallax]|uniref:galactose-binding domain-containing protein n=1 Tax=Acetobacter fallax TaxID=1737473 RepID=UPI0038D04BFB